MDEETNGLFIDDSYPSLICVPSTSNPPIAPPIIKKVSKFNEEALKKINNNKIKEIKDKLIKSFSKINKFHQIKLSEINLNNLKDIIQYIKLYRENILVSHKKEIYYYVMIGKLIKNIKIIYPFKWEKTLINENIDYTREYCYFLIRLFNLFDKNKILFQSNLSLSFLKKNFSVIKNIVKNSMLHQ